MRNNKRRSKFRDEWSKQINFNRSDTKENFERDFETHERQVKKKKPVIISPRGLHQKEYLAALEDPQVPIVVGVGPAGTGKTMIATLFAIKQLQNEKVDRIVITRPAVSVDEQHGFLPGTLNKKMEPWLLPILDVFEQYYTPKEIQTMMTNNIIHVAPFAYMRGRTFAKSIIICDETQNTTPNQMKMLLTRIGEDSKLIVTGDINQHDRGFEKNGLVDFLNKWDEHPSSNIEIIDFDKTDIQRHPIIAHVLKMYGEED